MRLDEQDREAITSAIKKLDPHAKIYLFGSRTDPQKRGGDIDILILSSQISKSDKPRILRYIFEKIEEQKIDLLIASDTMDPFVKLALKTGIEL